VLLSAASSLAMDKLDTPLDDLVKANRGHGGGSRGNRGGQRGRGGGGGARKFHSNDDDGNSGGERRFSRGGRGGGFRGSRDNSRGGRGGRGGGGPLRHRDNDSERPAPYAKRTRPGTLGDNVWSHDRFDGEGASEAPVSGGGKSSLEKRLSSALNSGGTFKSDGAGRADKSGWNIILIENIFNVTQEELQDLFAKEGEIKEVAVDFDRSGRSTGLATVAFTNKADADKAVTKYHGAQLENNTLKLSIVDGAYRFPRQATQDEGEGEAEGSSRPRRGGRGRGGFRGRRGQ